MFSLDFLSDKKPTFSKKGFLAHLGTGGIVPPFQSRQTSDTVGFTKPDMPKVPKTPTIDDARMQRQETDRIRRRRGIFANIFSGTTAAPSGSTLGA